MNKHQKYIIWDFISFTFKKQGKLIACDRRQDNGFLWGERQIVAGKEPKGDYRADGHALLIDLGSCRFIKLYIYCLCIFTCVFYILIKKCLLKDWMNCFICCFLQSVLLVIGSFLGLLEMILLLAKWSEVDIVT